MSFGTRSARSEGPQPTDDVPEPAARRPPAAEKLASHQRAYGNAAVVAFLGERVAESTEREAAATRAAVAGSPAGPAPPVHDDDRSRAWAAGIGARAFSWGGEIFLGAGASATPRRRAALVAHEATHAAEGSVVQRATLEEADLSVLRAALLDSLERARSFTNDLRSRRRFRAIEGNVEQMTASELRATIAEIEPLATRNQQRATAQATPLTPTATAPVHTDDDLFGDPDRVISENRNHQVYLLMSLLRTSSLFGAVGIREMLAAMGTDLDHVIWIPANNAGFTAATSMTTSGNPPQAEITVLLGPAMLMLMNRPDADMIPALYHEISHSFAAFSRVARRGRPAVPNLSRAAMDARVQQLAGTSVETDAQFAGSAVEFARRVESELYAELIEHSAMQDPGQRQRGPRTVGLGLPGGGIGTVTLNVQRRTEGEIADLLDQLLLLFGPGDGAQIARQLVARANADRFVHPDSRTMFADLVDWKFPPP